MALSADDNAKLAHLLRRAGFGARPSEWAEYAALGVAGATQQILHPQRVPDHLQEVLGDIGGDYVDFDDLGSIRHWWLYRLVHTRRPLEEKMTLFWHNHFATANYKVDNARRMWRQNETFRKYGLGSFRTLLQEVARDPAMLVWLDGNSNHVGKPNENFAREVMELFTLGEGGGYTEKDVQEMARAFTGWRGANSESGFVYDPTLHDDGEKTVLGQTGNWHADDVIDILVRQPATARFLATKLFRFFVHDSPSSADIARLGDVYFKSGYDISAVLEAIFTSQVFYSPAAHFAKIKSPVEYAVMTIRSLDAPMLAVRDLAGALALMGQELFNPPNVKGWPEGRAWINARTLIARVGFASTLTDEMSRRVSLLERLRGLSPTENAPARAISLKAGGERMAAPTMAAMEAPMMDNGTMKAPAMEAPGMAMPAPRAPTPANLSGEAAVETLWNALLPGLPIPPPTRASLVAYSQTNGKSDLAAKLPGLLNLIVSMPEYQLC